MAATATVWMLASSSVLLKIPLRSRKMAGGFLLSSEKPEMILGQISERV